MDTFLNETQVSEMLQVSLACLRRWRLIGKGPEYKKVGPLVRYRPEAISQWVADAMERALRGVHKASALAEQIGDSGFISILDKLRIKSMTTIPRLEALKTLVEELEQEAARLAA